MWTKSAHVPPSETSRRTLLKGSAAVAGGLVIGTYVDFGVRHAFAATVQDAPMPNAFIRIASDNTVTVLVKHLDKGQGVMTGLTTIVADELMPIGRRCVLNSPRQTPRSTTICCSGRSRPPAVRPRSRTPLTNSGRLRPLLAR